MNELIDSHTPPEIVASGSMVKEHHMTQHHTHHASIRSPTTFATITTNTLSDHLRMLLEAGTLADVTIVVENRSFTAHRAILFARSPYFAAMFRNDQSKESHDARIVLTDIPANVFELLLDFIYTDHIPLAAIDQHAVELFNAADKYQLDSLRARCEARLCSMLTVENVCDTLLLAELHSALPLKTQCIEFIVANAAAVITTSGWTRMTDCRPDIAVQLFRCVALKNV